MTKALVEQIFLAETWLERVSTQPPRVRLASLLLELCDDFGEPVEGGQRIRFRLAQVDLARMLNLSRETVSHLMADFTRAGWVSRDKGLLVVHNRAVLVELVRGSDAAQH